MNRSDHEGRTDEQLPKARKPPNVRRRSSKQGTSKDRHGVVFERSNGSTIRAATPDLPISQSEGGTPVVGSTLSTSHGNTRVAHAGQLRDHSGSFSTTDDENTIDSRRRRARTTSGTRDEPASDASPGSLFAKTRKRIGSITTTATSSTKADDQAISIGFPSVVQGATVSEGEDRSGPKTPRRTFSPDSVSTFASGGIRSPTWQESDSTRILQLMKTTCGRMHGILFFRPLHTTAWASGYCAIQMASGSLMCQVKGDVTQSKTLIPDLRGCSVRTHFDSDTQSTYLSVLTASTGSGFQLRPSVPETFDSWLAALLCWQPLRPRGVHNKMTKPQSVSIHETRPSGQRRISDLNTGRSMAIIKVGQMLSWDGPLPSGSQIAGTKFSKVYSEASDSLLWRRVSCTLHENGAFRIYTEGHSDPSSTTYLSQLSRCAVQRLDRSILEMPYCLAIYPHYTVQASGTRKKRPMILCLETRVAYEAWFVLLRALTVPELYGPEQNTQQGQDASTMFRIEQQLLVKVTEAKFAQGLTDRDHHETTKLKRKSARSRRPAADVYIDVVCGQDLKGRTAVKPCTNNVVWVTEFAFRDLPSVLSRVSVIARIGNPGEQEWTMIAHGPYDMSGDAALLTGVGGIEISSHDSVLGKVDVILEELEENGSIEKWWPIIDNSNKIIGQLLMKLTLQETIVLMNDEYQELSVLLHNFDNSLTTNIAQLLGPELRQLSDVLLDIFQSTNSVFDWLSNLIEEEIDGIHRDTPPLRMRFSGRLRSTDSYENAEQRELLVRDLNRSANQEANLLFRGNSLVTKALDSHMRRLGGEYLEAVLGSRLRKIAERDPDCEVDPMRVTSVEQSDRNWTTLLSLTGSIWKAISDSADLCPTELRNLFRHIRSCAEDRYGSFIRTVKYTSVSGFLFLRFFCPAILNPKLFGLAPGMFSKTRACLILTFRRSTSRPYKTDLYPHREVLECSRKYGEIWYQRNLDGTHEQIPHISDARFQDLHRQDMRRQSFAASFGGDGATVRHSHTDQGSPSAHLPRRSPKSSLSARLKQIAFGANRTLDCTRATEPGRGTRTRYYNSRVPHNLH